MCINRNLAGYTLTESLVSLAIVSVAITGIWCTCLMMSGGIGSLSDPEDIRNWQHLTDSISQNPTPGTRFYQKGTRQFKVEIRPEGPGCRIGISQHFPTNHFLQPAMPTLSFYASRQPHRKERL